MFHIKPTLMALSLIGILAGCDDDPASPGDPVDTTPVEQPVPDTDTPDNSDDPTDTPDDSDDPTDTPDNSDDPTDTSDDSSGFNWHGPVFTPTLRNHELVVTSDKVIITWYKNDAIWASVANPEDIDHSEVTNISQTDPLNFEFEVTTPDNLATANDFGEACSVWAEQEPIRIRSACYTAATGQWSDPFDLYVTDKANRSAGGLGLVTLSDGRFALVYLDHTTVFPYTDSFLEMVIFSPGIVHDRATLDHGFLKVELTTSPDDSGGVNVLYIANKPVDGELVTDELYLLQVDTALNATKTLIDSAIQFKDHLLITPGDNPAISFSGLDTNIQTTPTLVIYDQSLTRVDPGTFPNEVPYRHHTLIETPDGTLHYTWHMTSNNGVGHLIIKDGEVTKETSLSEQKNWQPEPLAFKVDEELYLLWIGLLEEQHSNAQLHLSQYIDGEWQVLDKFSCGEDDICELGATSPQVAVSDNLIAVSFDYKGEGVRVFTTDRK